MRVHIVLTIRMRQIDFATEETIMEDDIVFSSPMFDIGDDVDFNNAIALLLAKIESFTERGSNWIVVGIEKIDFRLIAYRSTPLFKGHSSRSTMYKLPPYIRNKKAVINLQYSPTQYNQSECFKWAVIATIHHTDIQSQSHKNFQSQYKNSKHATIFKTSHSHSQSAKPKNSSNKIPAYSSI